MKGRSGIVTGGVSGIGEAIVQDLRALGANVVVVDLDAEALRSLDQWSGDGIAVVEGDVSKEATAERAASACLESFGKIDFLVNCAGIAGELTGVEGTTLAGLNSVLSVNIGGTLLMTRAVLPHMKAAGEGSIVNISSTAGIRALPGYTSYTASKWGLVGLTLTTALEVAGFGIRANVVCPGPTDTPTSRASPEQAARTAATVPMGRVAAPREISAAVVWLLGPQASFVTGLVMPVDGGRALV